MTYDLDKIAAAVRAVTPDVLADCSDDILYIYEDMSLAVLTVRSWGKFSTNGYGETAKQRAIVRAVLDELDGQDAARGEGDR